MKNFSLRKAAAVLLLLNAGWAVSAHSPRLRIPYSPHSFIQQTISGNVADSRGPLPGVTVSIKGTTALTITDANGAFSIDAKIGDTLIFSFIGYKTSELTLQDYSFFKMVMTEDATSLQEVTVNAGYYTVKDKERTGSIAKITSKDIETQPVTNVLAAMQGRMAGVTITQAGGTPGGGFDISIRGQNSLRADGNTPLYIIDGVPYSSERIGIGQTNTILPGGTSPLANINPADIESLEVLKDADATAIYGSRGSNGVVLVTTKRGKAGGTRFYGSYSRGVGKVTRFMDLMNTQQYLAMRREGYANDGVEIPSFAYDLTTWDQNRYTDWQKKLLGGTADYTQISASVSGGSDRTQFLISGNFNKETTVFPGDFAYKKGNAHVSLNHQSTDQKFKASFSGSYTIQDNDQPSTDLTITAISLAPNAPALYDENGDLNWENGTFTNPLASQTGKSLAKSYDLVSNATFSYLILPELEAKANLGYTALNNHESSTFPSTQYDPSWNIGPQFSNIFYSDVDRHSWIIEPQLSYTKAFAKLKTQLLVGGTYQKQDNELLSMSASGFTSNSLIYNPAAATNLGVLANDVSEYKYQAFFGRANLNYDGKYILNITGRRDGSSRFGPENRFAWFGAIGAAWVFSGEDWFKEQGVLTFGKLRGSYGSTGSDQIGNYRYLDSYSPSGNNYNGIGGLQPTLLFNPNFGWETNRKLEVALETGFLNERINITAAWYRNRSSSQLVGLPLPGTTGFSSIEANLDATVENRGTELTLRTVNIKNDKLNWTTSLNISWAKNELVSFPGLETSTYVNQYVIGQPLNILKLYHYTGLNPATGAYTFEDYDGDGAITSPEDQKYIKDLNPKYFGGLQNEVTYGPWALDFLFQFVKQENYDIAYTLAQPGAMSNQSTLILDHWQQPGDTTGAQAYSSGANSDLANAYVQYLSSDAAIQDASYIRLKNVSLTYSIPKKWLGIDARVFYRAQNLLTITNFKGQDPEFRGVGFLPPLRMMTFGADFRF